MEKNLFRNTKARAECNRSLLVSGKKKIMLPSHLAMNVSEDQL